MLFSRRQLRRHCKKTFRFLTRTRIVCYAVLLLAGFWYLAIGGLSIHHLEDDVEDVDDRFLYEDHQVVTWKPAPFQSPDVDLPGSMGDAFLVPEDRKQEAKDRFNEYQLNVVASDTISLNRSLPDMRHSDCGRVLLTQLLPRTSVIIVFHQEAWSTLLRTVWSVINRSPRALLQEILLVDDASECEDLGYKLDKYVAELPVPVRVLRMKQRSGLIKARLLGAENARAEVLTFLDAHCECTAGWLENLLARVARDRRIVAAPVIDSISADTFKYIRTGGLQWGGFDWSLDFRWYDIPAREQKRRNDDHSVPIRSPTMAGGLLSIDKEYFYQIGSYDEGMLIWGSENIEMSFRVWQCGGVLEIVPCSRVGHIFRKTNPNSFPGGTTNIIYRNKNRLAAVWMDDLEEFFHTCTPGTRNVKTGDISERKALRQRLQCKSFRWYLNTVYPEATFPINYQYIGPIFNEGMHTCLDTMSKTGSAPVGLFGCHGQGGSQMFVHTEDGKIAHSELCLKATADVEQPVYLVRCYSSQSTDQRWKYDNTTKRIVSDSGRCLTSKDAKVVLTDCVPSNAAQRWFLSS